MKPGEYFHDGPDLEINAGRQTVQLKVTNTGDRPVQVGSHFHFFEVNRALVFDREKAYGMRLDLLSGTAIRFEPGDVKEVQLVDSRASAKSTVSTAWSWASSTIPPSARRPSSG